MSTKVRYAGSGGLNVRNAAAGTKTSTLNEGDLNTKTVSTSVPDKSKVYSSNLPLKQYQMLTNARYIYKYLKNSSSPSPSRSVLTSIP